MTNHSPTYKEKLDALREIMRAQGVDGYLVPRADEYQGEFVAPYAERLKWLTGFTGSGGAAVVLLDKAVVLTDGRYLIQVAQQVDTDLYEIADITKTSAASWVAEQAEQDIVIGFDPWLHTPKQLESFKENSIELKAVNSNLINEVWVDQPDIPRQCVELFSDDFTGEATAEKRLRLAGILKQKKLDAFVFTLPDSIAWLLNIRGGDVNYTPIALSYAALDSEGQVDWFIEPGQVPDDILVRLGNAVSVLSPVNMKNTLGKFCNMSVGLDFKRSPVWFKDTLQEGGAEIIDSKDLTIEPKAIKADSEQVAIKHAHIEDAVALASFLAWLDEEAPKGKLTELDVVEELEACRAKSSAYRGKSFPTIAGFGSNGAIVHYRATEETNAPIKPPGFLLVDSGGQYLDTRFAGTTDLTRTIVIGDASDEMKENFTRVLKGHIAIATAEFQSGTKGKNIDALARAALQEVGLDYAHGTGHGVGCYLAVHEEAAHLSPKGEEALQPGMLLSNEPGYYKEGAYGIRTENLVLVKNMGNEKLGFETVSLVPIDRRAIDKTLLSESEIAWVNRYHAHTWEALKNRLEGKSLEWLKNNTKPV